MKVQKKIVMNFIINIHKIKVKNEEQGKLSKLHKVLLFIELKKTYFIRPNICGIASCCSLFSLYLTSYIF